MVRMSQVKTAAMESIARKLAQVHRDTNEEDVKTLFAEGMRHSIDDSSVNDILHVNIESQISSSESQYIRDAVIFFEENITPYISFEIFLGDPIFSNTVFFVILSAFYKRASPEILFLVICLQYNINPLYVIPVFLMYKLFFSGRRFPRQYIKPDYKSVSADRLKSSDELTKTDFDHVIIGGDISALYTAALLSKCGHTCCVLSSKKGPQAKVITTTD